MSMFLFYEIPSLKLTFWHLKMDAWNIGILISFCWFSGMLVFRDVLHNKVKLLGGGNVVCGPNVGFFLVFPGLMASQEVHIVTSSPLQFPNLPLRFGCLTWMEKRRCGGLRCPFVFLFVEDLFSWIVALADFVSE